MSENKQDIHAQVVDSIMDIEAKEWDECAGYSNPFISHAFLSSLEQSGSVSTETGWLPQHVVIRDQNGNTCACCPLYLKNHSYGEYIFDWGWADAYERAGGKYYPKLQSAVPFTPVTGRRLLVKNSAPKEYYKFLVSTIIEVSRKHNVSSLHVTFPLEREWELLGKAGFLMRTSKQFHWENHSYSTFEEFLSQLTSRKRKAIKKERESLFQNQIVYKLLTGAELTENYWDIFYQYYLNTIDRKWGQAYLTRDFFSMLGERLPNAALLIVAERNGEPIAGALNLIGNDTIFGRNWGCRENLKFLHFETCYYQAIEYAIANKLRWVEAGAQGPHKIQRGYLPKEVYSAHWIENVNFRNAVDNFVIRERKEVDYEINELMKYSPYRSDESV